MRISALAFSFDEIVPTRKQYANALFARLRRWNTNFKFGDARFGSLAEKRRYYFLSSRNSTRWIPAISRKAETASASVPATTQRCRCINASAWFFLEISNSLTMKFLPLVERILANDRAKHLRVSLCLLQSPFKVVFRLGRLYRC